MNTGHLTPQALRVPEARYLRRENDGSIEETPKALFFRVAKTVARTEATLGDPIRQGYWQETFQQLLTSLDFLPNSPALFNAGNPEGQLSACFVLPVADSLEDIFETLQHAALIQRSGGGTGFSFSSLRPKGDFVHSTGGKASGPVAFMKIFDQTMEHIKQGGKRRGANMGVLRVDHPDIQEMGYPYKCGDARIPGWRAPSHSVGQRLERIIPNTTQTFSAGSLMMRLALTILIGFVGQTAFHVPNALATWDGV